MSGLTINISTWRGPCLELSLDPGDLAFVVCERPQGWELRHCPKCLVPDPAPPHVPLHRPLCCTLPLPRASGHSTLAELCFWSSFF